MPCRVWIVVRRPIIFNLREECNCEQITCTERGCKAYYPMFYPFPLFFYDDVLLFPPQGCKGGCELGATKRLWFGSGLYRGQASHDRGFVCRFCGAGSWC